MAAADEVVMQCYAVVAETDPAQTANVAMPVDPVDVARALERLGGAYRIGLVRPGPAPASIMAVAVLNQLRHTLDDIAAVDFVANHHPRCGGLASHGDGSQRDTHWPLVCRQQPVRSCWPVQTRRLLLSGLIACAMHSCAVVAGVACSA